MSLAFSPDGSRILSAGNDNDARIWEVSTGRELLTLKGHARPLFSSAFSPDGKRVITGSYDQTVRIWDATTGKEVSKLLGHTGAVTSVVFSHNGKQIATASDDGTARLWMSDASYDKARASRVKHDIPEEELLRLSKEQAHTQLNRALAKAGQTDRKVLLVLGPFNTSKSLKLRKAILSPELSAIFARWYVPVFLLSIALSDPEDTRFADGRDFLARYNPGTNAPSSLNIDILDKVGNKLIDSVDPHPGPGLPPTNIGLPESPGEIAYFLTMLRTTAPQIPATDLEKIGKYLAEHKD